MGEVFTPEILPPMEEDIVSKWSSLYQLSLMSFAMFVGAFGAGMLPLYASLSQRQLNVFNAMGTGLLLGTALAVIIPEGIHSLYHPGEDEESEVVHHHDESIHRGHLHTHDSGMSNETLIGVSLIAGFMMMFAIDYLACCGGGHGHSHGGGGGTTSGSSSSHHHHHRQKNNTGNLRDLGLDSTGPECESEDGDEDDSEMAQLTGIEMQVPGRSRRSRSSNSLSSFSPTIEHHVQRRATVTIGLLVHAAADGLALGAAKSSSTSGSWRHVELVVFFAIMFHKVPAAFALAVYLRNSGQDNAGIRRNLAWFAIAAPIGALVTFFILHKGFLGVGNVSGSVVSFGLLFSGGTFLYVALVHTFQELKDKKGELSQQQFVAICVGTILPCIIAAGHAH